MGAIRQQASTLYAPGQRVSKAASKAIFGTVEDQIAAAALGLVGLKMWTELEATEGARDNALALVAATDLGTHTDPVTGEEVPNAGYYRWNAPEAGWEWMTLATFGGSADVSCAITVAAPGVWKFSPLPGQPEVHPSGANQTFSGFIPADADGFAAVVDGVNTLADPRPAAFQGADFGTTGTLFEKEFVRIVFLEEGQVEILHPSPIAGGASSGGSAFLGMKLMGREPGTNNLHLEPTDGAHPNNTGDGYFQTWPIPADFEVMEGEVSFRTSGITMDPIVVTYMDGTPLPYDALQPLRTVIWWRPGGTGDYKVMQLWKPEDARQSGAGGGGTPYDRILARMTAENARTAAVLARRLQDEKLNVLNPKFEGVLSIGDAPPQGTNPAFLHARIIGPGDTASSPHAFSDSAALSFGGGLAYNSFEARFQVSGAGDYDHFSCFQALPLLATSGTTTNFYGLFVKPTITAGVMTNYIAADLRSPTIVAPGAVVNATGLVIRDMVGATGQVYGIRQEGVDDPNLFSGRVESPNMLRATGLGATPTTGAGVELRFNTASGGTGLINCADRGAGVNVPLVVNGLTVGLRTNSVDRLLITDTGARVVSGSLRNNSFTVATAPSASLHGAGAVIYVSDMGGGAELAFSDNTNWRRVSDRTIIS